MKKSLARREFLKGAGKNLGLGLIGYSLSESILGQILNRAFADTVGTASATGNKCYLHLSLPGGPPRWFFDLPLTPSGTVTSGSLKNFIPGGFGTRFEKRGADYSSFYSVDPYSIGGKNIHLPPVWGMDVENQKFSDLLPNTVFVRGLHMEINNHGLSNQRQVAPIIGGYSLTGAAADLAKSPIPAINDSVASSQAFRSHKGYSPSPISYVVNGSQNPVSSLLTPFAEYRNGRPIHREDREFLQNQALTQFERSAAIQGINSSALSKMYENAISLVDQNIVKVGDQWSATFAKYKRLISTALRPSKSSMPGFFDKAIPGSATGVFSYADDSNGFATLTDLRDMIGTNTDIERMAENFTIAELMIDQVSSSFTLGFPSLSQLESGHGLFNLTHDQHNVGSIVSTMATTLFYRAFLSCISELVSQLKQKNLFERTMIHVSSEFNRAPRIDGSGSDHGYMAGNTTLISGMIDQGGVIGNIRQDFTERYKGTFGVADIYNLDGFERPIQVNDVALTVTSMFGADSIVTNGRSLLEPNNGKWKIRKEEAVNNV